MTFIFFHIICATMHRFAALLQRIRLTIAILLKDSFFLFVTMACARVSPFCVKGKHLWVDPAEKQVRPGRVTLV